jgi:TonB family protein
MDSKKIFLWPVIISIIGHIALLAVSSMVDLRDNVKAAELFTVQIAQSEPAPEAKKEEKPARETIPPKPEEEKPLPEGGREDTVDIGSSDIKYAAYLAGVKKKIMPLWKSSEAYKKNDNGIVGIKISLDADGSLAQLSLISTSGFPGLDQGTLDIVRAAAPFQPLPLQYELSRLHITASFRYSATE